MNKRKEKKSWKKLHKDVTRELRLFKDKSDISKSLALKIRKLIDKYKKLKIDGIVKYEERDIVNG